ncbi:PREDICTED: tyrosine-protein phosphatase non-receptor type substrate 1-like, partial [Acanthisitta chloris]|uniref:tyrosine-protein phosphatase non-receptor type substrate 1-like n=1 Tax=Acanthisitta chloris TaxID=57068 RepID=UPI0004F0D752
SAQPPQVTEWQAKSSYNMSSTVTVTLQESDISSELICKVWHRTLTTPLQGTYKLSRALRVSPSVNVRADQSSPIELNKTVNFTCHVRRFYPANVSVTWLENEMQIKVENVSQPSEIHGGLFELRSQVEVQATVDKNGSVFTCLVVDDASSSVRNSTILRIADPAQEGPSDWSQMDN